MNVKSTNNATMCLITSSFKWLYSKTIALQFMCVIMLCTCTQFTTLSAQTDVPAPPKMRLFTTILPWSDEPEDIWVEVRDTFLIYDGDMIVGTLRDTANFVTPSGVGVSNGAFLWPNGIMPYTFRDSFTQREKDTILAAIAHINTAGVGINIKLRTTETNYIVFKRATEYSSYIGKQSASSRGQIVNVYPTSSAYVSHKGSTIHELLHALGIGHEHKRSDRNKYIGIIGSAFGGGTDDTEKNVLELYGYSSYMDIGDYDYRSIMHYAKGRYGGGSYIVPPKDVEIGQSIGLSAKDKLTIRSLYQSSAYIKKPVPLHVFTTNGGSYPVSYSSNVICSAESDASWLRIDRHEQGKVYISCLANTGAKRTAYLTVYSNNGLTKISKTMMVVQEGTEYIDVTPATSFSKDYQAQKFTISVSSNIVGYWSDYTVYGYPVWFWHLRKDVSWIKVEPIYFDGNIFPNRKYTVEISLDENTTYQTRIGKVTIWEGAVKKEITIEQSGKPCSLSVVPTSIPAICTNNGSVNVTVTGGTPPYRYAWSNGRTTQSITNLAAGTYTVTVTDAGGCSKTASVVVGSDNTSCNSYDEPCGKPLDVSPSCVYTEGSNVNATLSMVNTSGLCTTVSKDVWFQFIAPTSGHVTIKAISRTLPDGVMALYRKNSTCTNLSLLDCSDDEGEGNTPFIQRSNLIAGETYVIRFWGYGGVSGTFGICVQGESCPTIALTTTSTTATCGTNNGTATVLTTIGGTAPYYYVWNNGQVGKSISNLIAGTYTVTVTDNNGCTESNTVIVGGNSTGCINNDNPCGISLNVNSNNCNYTQGTNVGATTTFVPSWTSITCPNYAPKDVWYRFVSNVNGTVIIETSSGSMSDGVMALYRQRTSCTDLEYIACEDDGNGYMPRITLYNAIAGQVYHIRLWGRNGQEGTFQICVRTEGFVCPTINLTATATNNSCNANNGTATAIATGGTSPYTYNWSNGRSGQTVTNLAGGTYSVTATDARGCSSVGKSITISTRVCPLNIDPVCGSDGITYNNACEAECAGVSWTPGRCVPNPTVCVPCTSPNNDNFCDNFQPYSPLSGGYLGPQSPCWTTWSGIEGGAQDGIIRRASDGNQYLYLLGGGTQDVVLQLGNKTSGKYQLKFRMVINQQNKGYYNILNAFTAGGQNTNVWAQEVFFNGNGQGQLRVSGVYTAFTYATGKWIDIIQDFDLDNGTTVLNIDGRVVKEWLLNMNRLAALDFYPIDNTHLFFIDDVVLEKKADCVCPLYIDPVCGADGKTYTNACFAACANTSVVPCFNPTPPISIIIAPNPMTTTSRAIISVVEEQEGKIEIFETRGGKLIQEATIKLTKGMNEWQIDNKYFPSNGVYIFRLKTNQGVISKKIVYTPNASNSYKD